MSELTATIHERAAAAQAAHAYAWTMQRRADRDGDWNMAAFWSDTCDACNEELAEAAIVMRAGLDAEPAPQPDDGILRGNADVASVSACYLPAEA